MEIGYWNLRGLVGFCRLIAEYTGEPVKWTWSDINTDGQGLKIYLKFLKNLPITQY